MSSSRWEHHGPFRAQAAGGDRYMIYLFREFTTTPQGRAAGAADVPGAVRLRTNGGRPVERLERGRYRIALPGGGAVEVTSADPDAP